MRPFLTLPVLAVLAIAWPACAQPAPTAPERPIDHGPNTPTANNAYQGGGVVLEGKPGAPAPTPQAMPPALPPAGSTKP